jgi:hypothetical protein
MDNEDIDNISKIEIYDITGRFVYLIKDNKEIDFVSLPAGIYIAKIYTKDKKVISNKFIKK